MTKIGFKLFSLFQILFIGHSTASFYGSHGKQIECLGGTLMRANIKTSSTIDPSVEVYKKMILELEIDEQLRLLIKTIPNNQEEALEVMLREILLYQQIFQEQIIAIEALEANPHEHRELAKNILEFNFHPWMIYANAKMTVGWCNVLARWVSWIGRHSEAGQTQIDRLFETIFRAYQTSLINAEKGVKRFLNGIGNIYSPAYTLALVKCREVLIRPVNIPLSGWFHDNISPSLLFYSSLCHLIRPYATDDIVFRVYFQNPPSEQGWPKEHKVFAHALDTRVLFKTRNRTDATLRQIGNALKELCKLEPYKIGSDLWDESIDDFAFERSYIDPLHLKGNPKESIKTVKTESGKKKKAKNGAKGKRKSGKKKNVSHPASSLLQDYIPMADDFISTSTDCVLTKDELDEYIQVPSVQDIVDISQQPYDKEIEEIDPIPTKLEKAEFEESSEEEEKENWEEKMIRERNHYALEKKKEAQIRKVIRQQQKERMESERRTQIRQNIRTRWKGIPNSSSQSGTSILPTMPTDVIHLDSTELCLAFPQSHDLFLTNKNITSIKANIFRWFFDPVVTIKQKHMNFLCILFNLEPGKGQLTFLDMAKTYWAIEKCFYNSEPMRPSKDLRRTFLQWSHRFEINGVLVAPSGKDVHPEHESSGFNHSEALALFNSGGFDPRFFKPEY
jgi:hypothetical protein